jgi:hypothetical protein
MEDREARRRSIRSAQAPSPSPDPPPPPPGLTEERSTRSGRQWAQGTREPSLESTNLTCLPCKEKKAKCK